MACSAQGWGRTLVVCNVFSWVIGITVFGLAIGTVRNEVFKLGVWAYLKPLRDMACADIAAGVFICAGAVAGCFTVAYRSYWLHVVNITALVFLFAYTLSVGIATLVICAEKTEALRKLTVLICMSTWGSSRSRGPSSVPVTLQPVPTLPTSAAVNTALNVINNLASSQIGPDSKAPFGLDVFHSNPVPKTMQDCDYFNDLMTPCGALLIVVAIVYLFILGVAVSLYQTDSKNQVESKPRNQRDNVAMNQV